jgi:putative heme iron utilization protein
MAKLTLNIDAQLIERAKAHAQRHHVSLSQLVAQLLTTLEPEPHDDFFAQLHADMLREGFQEPPADLTAFRQQHVERKYR